MPLSSVQLTQLKADAGSLAAASAKLSADINALVADSSMTFTAAVSGTNECTVSWTGVSPTQLARNGVDTTGGGPWNTGPLTDQPTSGSFKFELLVPGDTYTYTLTYAGGTLTTSLLQPPVVTPSPPPTTGKAGFGQPVMAPPAGYTAAQLLWSDTFGAGALDTTHWANTWGSLAWNNEPGYVKGSATVQPSSTGGGLLLDNTTSGPSSCVVTCLPAQSPGVPAGKILTQLPAAGFFLQFKAQMSDMSNGFFPAGWFVDQFGPGAEIDMFEGGDTMPGVPTNQVWEGNYGATAGKGGSESWDGANVNTGVDLTAGFHTYGIEWRPGVSCKLYCDGVLRKTALASEEPEMPGSAYYVFGFTPQFTPGGSSGWHSQGPGTGQMKIAEVQLYSL